MRTIAEDSRSNIYILIRAAGRIFSNLSLAIAVQNS